MRTNYWITPVALVAVMGVAGVASAQMQIGDQTYAEADIGLVQEHCDELQAAEIIREADAPSGDATPEDVTGAGFGAEPIHPGTDLDLDRVTLQDCEAAGFL